MTPEERKAERQKRVKERTPFLNRLQAQRKAENAAQSIDDWDPSTFRRRKRTIDPDKERIMFWVKDD